MVSKVAGKVGCAVTGEHCHRTVGEVAAKHLLDVAIPVTREVVEEAVAGRPGPPLFLLPSCSCPFPSSLTYVPYRESDRASTEERGGLGAPHRRGMDRVKGRGGSTWRGGGGGGVVRRWAGGQSSASAPGTKKTSRPEEQKQNNNQPAKTTVELVFIPLICLLCSVLIVLFLFSVVLAVITTAKIPTEGKNMITVTDIPTKGKIVSMTATFDKVGVTTKGCDHHIHGHDVNSCPKL